MIFAILEHLICLCENGESHLAGCRILCKRIFGFWIDGKPVDKTILENVKESFPRWKTLPYKLRAKRADLFINLNSDVPFLQSLVDFLKSKCLDIKPYDDSVNYLPSDILLLDKTDLVRQGTVYVLQAGKRAIWNELLIEFGDRLK